MAKPIIEIRLIGPGLTPGQVSSQKIATVLDAVESMVAAMVSNKHPTMNREQVILGLSQVKQGSLSLLLEPNLALVFPIMDEIGDAIQKNNVISLPPDVRKSLKRLVEVNRDLDAKIDFLVCQGDDYQFLATLSAHDQISEPIFIKGTTTIYGEIVRVGGTDPVIQVQPISGNPISCKTTRDLAQKAGQLLYRQVKLEGSGEWCTQTCELTNFTVTEITEFQDSLVTENFAALCSEFSTYFNGVDPDQFVRELRRED